MAFWKVALEYRTEYSTGDARRANGDHNVLTFGFPLLPTSNREMTEHHRHSTEARHCQSGGYAIGGLQVSTRLSELTPVAPRPCSIGLNVPRYGIGCPSAFHLRCMFLPSCWYEMTYPRDACFPLLPSCSYEMNEPNNEMTERICCKSLFHIGF